MTTALVQPRLKEAAQELGFSLVRFTRPPLGEAAERFKQWLAAGYEGGMNYMSRHPYRRAHPEVHLPPLRSIVVLAHPYAQGQGYDPPSYQGKLARYAWGEDYHRVLRDKLNLLVERLQSWVPKSQWYISIDAQEVLEKGWAQKAGLGWMGKHSNMIHADEGSYFFLSVLLTDLAFEPDEPTEDHCGTCARCMEVCPTRAIVAPYVLDAKLCISYLTIELKGSIPRRLRPMIGNRIFGCDDCQEVCPWNRFGKEAKDLAFTLRSDLARKDLSYWLQLSSGEFKRALKASPLSRPRWKGFMRNVLVAAGNSGESRLAELVAQKLDHQVDLIREHAVWAYARLLGPEARGALSACLAKEEHEGVRREIQLSLQEINGSS